jgi:hypothetical protein
MVTWLGGSGSHAVLWWLCGVAVAAVVTWLDGGGGSHVTVAVGSYHVVVAVA